MTKQLSKEKQKVWDRLTHVSTETNPRSYHYHQQAPANPKPGDVYFNTSNTTIKVYDGTNWKLVR